MMKSKRVFVSGSLLWGLAILTSTLVKGQDLRSLAEANFASGESLWYGQYSSDESGKKAEYLDCCSPCPMIYGYVEALFLQRTNCSFDQPIIVQSIAGIPVATFLSTSDLDFEYEPGVRALFGIRLHGGWALEGSYLGLWDSDASLVIVPPDESTNLTFPGGLGGTNVFSDPDRIWTTYSSSLHSSELNLVCCSGYCDTFGGKGDLKDDVGGCHPRCQTVEWLVGFRYLSLNERLRIYGERDQIGQDRIFREEAGIYSVRTNNNLYGAHVGARTRHWRERWGWEATGKAGIFANDAQQEQYVIDYQEFVVRPLTSASTDRAAFIGELNLTGIYRLNENWNLRAGYNAIWISGVALAPNQLDFSGELPAGNQLSSNGSVFLHGVNCGIEARW